MRQGIARGRGRNAEWEIVRWAKLYDAPPRRRQTQWAAMPSPLPVKPSFSSVVAFTGSGEGIAAHAVVLIEEIGQGPSFS